MENDDLSRLRTTTFDCWNMLFDILSPSSSGFVERSSVVLILTCWCEVVDSVNLVNSLSIMLISYGSKEGVKQNVPCPTEEIFNIDSQGESSQNSSRQAHCPR